MNETIFEQRRLEYFQHCGSPMIARRVYDRQGQTLFAMESGTSGEPVIVIHSGGDDASEWATLLPHLTRDRRWIVVDRPGHGLSYKLDYTRVDFRRAAVAYIADLLDGLEISRATFLGCSMGGYFSLCFALAHPERVERLVLVSAPAGVDRWLPPFLRLMGRRGINRLVFALMRNPTPEQLREKVFRPLLVAKPDQVPEAFLKLEIAAWQLPGAERAWRTLLESVTTLRGFRRRYFIRDEVSRLAVPTTFVWGDRDVFALPSISGADLVARMPRARLVTIKGAGHIVWFDELENCARAVNDALSTPTARLETAPRSER